MQVVSRSDCGVLRSQNQDFCYCTGTPVGRLPNLLIVADGMGGHQAGDFASRYTVEKLVEHLPDSIYENPLLIVNDTIRNVNRMLYEKSKENPAYSGMGTTLVLAFVIQYTLHVFHIGDSRLYRYSGNRLTQITRDHSYVDEMVKKGLMKRDSSEYKLKKNIITRAVGTHEYVMPDIYEESLFKGDLVLLCSDGLTNMVEDSEIQKILETEEPLEAKAEHLVALANEKGGQDNITLVLALIE